MGMPLSTTTDVSKLVGLYALISEMRVLSSRNTIENADAVARMIVNTYRAPDQTLPELQDMVNRGAIDVLQTFSRRPSRISKTGRVKKSKIVPSNRMMQYNPAAIREVRPILRLNLANSL